MTKDALLQRIERDKLILFYFKGSQCSACLALYPKVKQMIRKYPQVHLHVIQLDEEPELAAYLNIYSVPAVLLYVEGREYIREAGIFSVQTLEAKIKRLVNLINED